MAITAANRVSPNATQGFTLTVIEGTHLPLVPQATGWRGIEPAAGSAEGAPLIRFARPTEPDGTRSTSGTPMDPTAHWPEPGR